MSSPITQWPKTITTILEDHFKHTLELRLDEDIPAAAQAITSATIELALALIGEDEPLPTSLFDWGDDDQRKYWYNKHRAELRQSLKHLKEDLPSERSA